MNIWIKLTILGIMGLILLGTFFAPAIIAIVTGNPWFLLLFCVSWTPTIGEVIVFVGILELME
jgi:hypothetical protein